MSIDSFFKFVSYAAVSCGFLSLWVTGTLGVIVPVIFVVVLFFAAFLENSRWQIAERPGTLLIVT